ncbi:MAG: hypothetical protein J7501_06145 [Bdellovibrio sp.]|nr:hypothetical protein [Bdellovibrio sp.]
MSIQKIHEINAEAPSTVFRFLEKLAKEKGSLECVSHTEYSPEILKDADLVLFSFAQSNELLPLLSVLPSLVRSLGCFDAYAPDDGKWYPRAFLYEAIRKVLIENARDLDTRAPAFVVGSGEEARVAAAVCANLGLQEIYLIGEDTVALQEEAKILTRNFLGIQFKILPIEELTIQAISASLVINTCDLRPQEALLNDLSYFNFMKTGGYALDAYLGVLHSDLLEEAERAELKVLYPAQVLKALVEVILERIHIQNLVSNTELAEMIQAFTKENSSSV